MAGGYSSSERGGGGGADVPLSLIHDIHRISTAARFSGLFKKECADLARRISLLTHFLEEIRDSEKIQRIGEVGSSSSHFCCFSDLTLVLHEAKGLLLSSNNFDVSENFSVIAEKRIIVRFQSVTTKLEQVLTNFPYYDFEIPEEAQDQVNLVRTQLRRAVLRFNVCDSSLSQSSNIESFNFDSAMNIDCRVKPKADSKNVESKGSEKCAVDEVTDKKECLRNSNEMNVVEKSDKMILENTTSKSDDEIKKLSSHNSLTIPFDFLCPISLELIRDPVIVATGQTYERSCIQRWIDCGNKTCPKTRQKLRHLNLTPNYLLRRLISQWCSKNIDVKIRKTDGAIRALVDTLSIQSTEGIRSALAEIRLLSKRSNDNRILLAEAGAIPKIVNLLTSQDARIQDNAVTCILNLSIYESNKELIVLADAIPLIVRVLGTGSMEAKENAAATLFCLSLVDENKIIIGASGAIPALVHLLKNGSLRGKRDAATAIFHLCLYPQNKGRAIRAGIITPLLNMLTDSSNSFVDESLTIIAVLVSSNEAKRMISKINMIPVLIDLVRTGAARNQENASSILLSLCKRNKERLESVSRLGAVAPLLELTKNGTERGRKKAMLLLELVFKAQHD